MKAKLIKTIDEQGVMYSLSGKDLPENYVLSLKNCQDIECGYDLDEEVSNIVKTIVPDDRGTDIWYGTSMAVGKLCFQKALEILGDKKFSERDLHHALHLMNNQGRIPYIDNALEMVAKTTEQRDKIIQSLQQTEWDVEIREECLDKNCDGINRKGECITTGKPKHDTDGCLILKRVK